MAVLIYNLLPKDLLELNISKLTIKNKLKDCVRSITIEQSKPKCNLTSFKYDKIRNSTKQISFSF